MYGTAKPLYMVSKTALGSAVVADSSSLLLNFRYLKPNLLSLP